MTELRVAVCQMNSRDDIEANLLSAERLLDRAAAAGARLAVLPEHVDFLGPAEATLATAAPLDSPAATRIAAKAAEHDMWVLAGTLHEELDEQGRFGNTSQLFDPAGRQHAVYRKMHTFDVALASGFAYRESDTVRPGDSLTLTEVDGVPVGMAICYDLRFPGLFAAYSEAGARIVVLPSAFTFATGAAHWELLVRARAVENQCFILAANQFGPYGEGSSYGHSMIVDPWGTVLATAPDSGEAIAVADLDLDAQDSMREQIPVLSHRRSDLYRVAAANPIGAHT